MIAPAGLHALIWVVIPVIATLSFLHQLQRLRPVRHRPRQLRTAFAIRCSAVHLNTVIFSSSPFRWRWPSRVLAVLLDQPIRAGPGTGRPCSCRRSRRPYGRDGLLQIYDPQSGLANRFRRAGINGPAWLPIRATRCPRSSSWGIWPASYPDAHLPGALQNIPADIYEAAELDGANAWQRFTASRCPLLRPERSSSRSCRDQRLPVSTSVRTDRRRPANATNDDDLRDLTRSASSTSRWAWRWPSPSSCSPSSSPSRWSTIA